MHAITSTTIVQVLLLCGLTHAQGSPFTFLGDADGDLLGISVSAAGDADGDGVQDLVVGAYQGHPDFPGAGFARLYSGSDGSILRTVAGAAAGDAFGFSVSGAGDVDADGYDDVMVGAPRDDDNGADSGRVRVYSGLTGGVLYTFDGLAAGDEFGAVLEGLGDINEDGHADFACAAPLSDLASTDAGAVFVYSGKAGNTLWSYRGAVGSANFGTAVASIGDLDGDGRSDMAIGTPNQVINSLALGRVITFLAPPRATMVMQPE